MRPAIGAVRLAGAGGFVCAALLAAATALAALGPASALAAQRTMRVGAAPRTPPGAGALGALPASAPLQLIVALRPRDPAALASYATAVSTPGSPDEHDYLTPTEFRQLFGPTSGEVATVEQALRAQGLDPGPASADGLLIPIDANAGTAARGLGIGFERYRLASGRIAYANTSAPQLSTAIASLVTGIVGLDDIALPHAVGLAPGRRARRASRLAPHVVTGGPQPCSTAVTDAPEWGAYTADQLASAYNFSSLYGAGDLGAGETVALVELSTNPAAYVSTYQSCYGTAAAVHDIVVDGGSSSSTTIDGEAEATLDIDDVLGLSPASTIDVYQAPNSYFGILEDYAAIVDNPSVTVVSTSWGECESDAGSSLIGAEATLLEQAAAEGQSVFAAAGDDGSNDCNGGGGSDPALAVDDPGSQPDVTSVGGLTLSSTTYPPAESVWNDSGADNGAGGGGISTVTTMPSYQSDTPTSLHVINANSSGVPCGAPASEYCREVPDVSADGDPQTGYLIYFPPFGGWVGIGGTSAAAPLWAAFAALTDASHACSGGAIGFANPSLYTAASGAYASDFTDVTSGDNAYSPSGYGGDLYPAGVGYDMASGLGSPNGATLPAALCGTALASPAVSVTDPGTQNGQTGTAASLQIAAGDSAHESLRFVATGLPAGLTISAGGAITGTPTTAGTASVTVTATDTSGASGSTTFSWRMSNGVSVTNPGSPATTVGTPVSLQIAATDSGGSPLTFSASGLPAGLSISAGGTITGTPTSAGMSSVTVTATDTTGATGATTFTWTVAPAPAPPILPTPAPPTPTTTTTPATPAVSCAGGELLTNPDLASGGHGWSASPDVIVDRKQAGDRERPRTGTTFAWFGGHGRPLTASLSQTITIPAGCYDATLTFWHHIDTTRSRSGRATDTLTIELAGARGAAPKVIVAFTNRDAGHGYQRASVLVAVRPGVRETLRFVATLAKRGAGSTDFCIDDITLTPL